MGQDDLDELLETGERLPLEMLEPGLLTDEGAFTHPVFDGEKIIDKPQE